MRKLTLALGIIVGLLILVTKSNAQSTKAFLYGTVTTISGDKYEGAIRWGTDEVYWADMLNATKVTNDFTEYLSKEELESLKESGSSSWLGIDIDILNIWEDRYSNSQHSFDTQFGNIKTIKPAGRQRASITTKNGIMFLVNGSNSSDIGEDLTVHVMDMELGVVKLRWSRIEQIDFKATPENLKETFGEPIYGKVNAGRRGKFEGFINWDYSSNSEKFLSHILDGKVRGRDRKVEFKNIQSISKNRSGVDVILHNQDNLYLSGTRDVNSSNGGIVVNDPEIGRVVVAWRDFVSLEIVEEQTAVQGYDDFVASKGLEGTVRTIDGDELEGLIAFDLDEAWEYEVLNAKDGSTKFEIPFANVQRIVPRNSSFSSVDLKNGVNLLLGEERDVSESNAGILIFTSSNERPKYVRWSKVDEILFK